MSLGESHIPEDEARTEAEVELRLEIGNLPHLGDPHMDQNEYVFPLLVSLPRVSFDKTGEEPIGVRFLSDEEIGEIRVDAISGEIVDRTSLKDIEDRIDSKKEEIERAVQKALIKSSAGAFSRLPYSLHRNSPVVDILSEMILSEQLSESRLMSMGEEDYEKYQDHLEVLIDVGLIRREDSKFVAGDELTEIVSSDKQPSDHLNEAMKFLFENRADDLEMMHGILGPHLKIAGYYYRRAVESDELPEVSKSDLQRHFTREYSGKKAKRRGFKISRYLLQLEQVGLLKSKGNQGQRVWKGERATVDNILSQKQHLSPIAEVTGA